MKKEKWAAGRAFLRYVRASGGREKKERRKRKGTAPLPETGPRADPSLNGRQGRDREKERGKEREFAIGSERKCGR